jgi:hypothetical protein
VRFCPVGRAIPLCSISLRDVNGGDDSSDIHVFERFYAAKAKPIALKALSSKVYLSFLYNLGFV